MADSTPSHCMEIFDGCIDEQLCDCKCAVCAETAQKFRELGDFIEKHPIHTPGIRCG